jgi:molybdopterin converting factor subunit 1
MPLKVLLFAAARDDMGCDSVEIDAPDDAVASDVLRKLSELSPFMAQLVPYCRLAIDERYADASASIQGAREIALIPPVSGG